MWLLPELSTDINNKKNALKPDFSAAKTNICFLVTVISYGTQISDHYKKDYSGSQ